MEQYLILSNLSWFKKKLIYYLKIRILLQNAKKRSSSSNVWEINFSLGFEPNFVISIYGFIHITIQFYSNPSAKCLYQYFSTYL